MTPQMVGLIEWEDGAVVHHDGKIGARVGIQSSVLTILSLRHQLYIHKEISQRQTLYEIG